jgi:hypothetical protein
LPKIDPRKLLKVSSWPLDCAWLAAYCVAAGAAENGAAMVMARASGISVERFFMAGLSNVSERRCNIRDPQLVPKRPAQRATASSAGRNPGL